MTSGEKFFIQILIVLGCVILFFSQASVSSSFVCPHCLQTAGMVEKEVLGITVYRSKLKLRDEYSAQGGLPVDPNLYTQIIGRPCTHNFKRAGFCRYTFGMVGCGSYGSGSLFRHRNLATEEVYRAYGRVGDKALARKTLGLLETWQPANSTLSANSSILGLNYQLASVTNAQQWEQVIMASIARAADTNVTNIPASLPVESGR